MFFHTLKNGPRRLRAGLDQMSPQVALVSTGIYMMILTSIQTSMIRKDIKAINDKHESSIAKLIY